MSWIGAVQEMLRADLVVPYAELREEDAGSRCSPVRIHRSGKSIIISMNAPVDGVSIKDRLFPLFRQIEGVARMCDYWIMCETTDEGLYVLLCELKSGDSSGLAQLENAKLLATYFIDMVRHHQNVGGGIVEYRGLVFSPVHKTPKSGLRPGKMPYREEGRLGLKVALLNDRALYNVSAFCA